MKRNSLFIIYLILGLYLINMGFSFINLSFIGSKFLHFLNQGILLVSAIIILIDAFRYIRKY